LIDGLIGKRDLEGSREVLVTWQLRRSKPTYVSMAHILIYNNTWYNNHFNLTARVSNIS